MELDTLVALIIALLLKLWCKGKHFYDKGQGINAEPLTWVLWQYMADRTEEQRIAIPIMHS